MEDLTTYTKVGYLTVTASKVSGYFGGDADRYLYKDFGADNFDGINLKFDGLIEDSDPYGYSGKMYAGFSNVVNDVSAWISTGVAHITIDFRRSGGYGEGLYYIALRNYGNASSSDLSLIDPDTIYYLTLTRPPGSDTASLKIYTDAARTSLYDTLSISSLGTEKWRYFYAASSFNDGDSSDVANGYYQNFEFLGKSAGQVRFIGMMM